MPCGVNVIGNANPCERGMVATVTVTGTDAPFNKTLLGATVQVDMAGAPLHFKVTL